MHKPTRSLRELLAAPGIICSLGAHDVLTALIIEQAGFETVFIGGFGASASMLGLPDLNFLTMTEMADAVRRMASRLRIPVIADGDTGHGDLHNVQRTVTTFELAGAAGILLEDQVAPKRCGHMSGKQVVAVSEMTEKLQAAVAARQNPDFVLIARTDARAVEGLDAALERASAYRDAGADVLFVEAPQSEDEIVAVAEAFPDVPLLFNWVERGMTPMLPLERIAELGFALVLFPVATLFSATAGMQRYLGELRRTGTPLSALDDATPFDDFTDLVHLPEVRAFESRITGS
jgi:2,3-dimethylmalate lyase